MDDSFQGGSDFREDQGRKGDEKHEGHEGHEGHQGHEGHEDEEASWEVNQDYYEEKGYYGIEGQEDSGQDKQRFTKEEPISVPIFVVFLFELIMGTWHGSPA